jgi:protein-tyrosine phosphatase
MVRKVFFLCSANYYRSRFAEQLFNHLARAAGLAWRAESRGLLVGFWGDVGPISSFTLDALQERAIPLDDHHRHPQALTAADLLQADLVVAVKESEHRELIAAQFPDWSERVEYWDVDDLDCAGPEQALPYLEDRVRALIARLQGEADTPQADVA